MEPSTPQAHLPQVHNFTRVAEPRLIFYPVIELFPSNCVSQYEIVRNALIHGLVRVCLIVSKVRANMAQYDMQSTETEMR